MGHPTSTFHRPLRLTIAALWIVGIALAGFTAPRAWVRLGAASAVPFIMVAALGIVLTRSVLRGRRWALRLSAVLLGGQLAGVIGSAWQLLQGVNGTKARELRRLGVNPRFGVAVNLVYSSAAVAVFGWIAARRLAAGRTNRRAHPGPIPPR